MRKNFYSNLFVQFVTCYAIASLATSNLQAQVFNGNLTINTQAQVDAFTYTQVTGILSIKQLSPGAILNLDGLSELTTVGKSLFITDCASLTNLNGLSNLATIGEIFGIENNDGLTNLDGLSGLTSVGNSLQFNDNSHLANIDGLSNLSTLDNGFNFTNNSALTNIDGLSNLTSLGGGLLVLKQNSNLLNVDGLSNVVGGVSYIDIEENPLLTNVDGLSHISIAFLDVFIKSNNVLSNIDGLSALTSINGRCEIQNNPALQSLGLTKLVAVDGIFFIGFNNALSNINGLAKLKTAGGHFSVTGCPALLNIDGLSALETVNGNFAIAGNNLITNLNALAKLTTVDLSLSIINNPALIDFCGLYNLFNTGNIGGSITIKNNGANTVIFTPSDVTVNTDPGVCSAVIPNASIPDPISGCLPTITKLHTNFPAGNIFPSGVTTITWFANDGAGNTAAGIQNITVVDNEPPVITSCPANLTVSCAADVPAADVSLVTATDNCSVTVTHVGDNITNQTCANRFTLTRTYQATDGAGNTARCSQVINVNDNTPPQINSLALSQTTLWPPNHTMRDITLNYSVTDNCTTNATTTVTISSNEPVNGTADGDTDPDWIIVDNHHIKLRAERAANGDGRIYTITITVSDGCNASVSASTQVRVAHNITGPHSGDSFKIGSTVSFNGEFWDVPVNKHTAKWLIDDNTTVKATVTEPLVNKNGKVTGSYKFTSPGVYKLQMNITDQNGITSYANTNGDIEEIIVIYDPNGGNTYGGGYFNSPAGALRSDPSATGKASYGFAMNYFKNSTYPKGETQFEFKVGNFEFNALNFDYMVINNAMAQFKGTGKITGGQSGIGFTMTVVDGQLDGTGIDKIRMKIYNKNNNAVIYDNQFGASDAALPTQAVGPNSSIVISGINSSLTSANTDQKAAMEVIVPEVLNKFDVITYPNPSTNSFSLTVNAASKEKINMQVIDMYGRIIETRNITESSTIKFGDRYIGGTYFVRIIQGKVHREIKLIKLSE